MSDRTFDQFIREFFDYYERKDYAGALDYLNRGGAQYPEMAPIVTYNQVCMLAVQNCVPEALAMLHQAANRGFWYAENTLREDTDLVSLQGDADFEKLIRTFKSRHDEAQAKSTPSRIVVEPPPRTPKPYPLLLALHGNNSQAVRERQHWEPAATAGWLTAMLQSSQIGMTEGSYIWNDEAKSASEVAQHCAELSQLYGVKSEQVVVGGFSRGGRMAASLGLDQPFPVRGFIGVGAYIAGKLDVWEEKIIAAGARGTRAYLIIGDKDEGYEDVTRFADMLKHHGIDCELKIYPGMDHEFPSDFDTVLIEALKFMAD